MRLVLATWLLLCAPVIAQDGDEDPNQAIRSCLGVTVPEPIGDSGVQR